MCNQSEANKNINVALELSINEIPLLRIFEKLTKELKI